MVFSVLARQLRGSRADGDPGSATGGTPPRDRTSGLGVGSGGLLPGPGDDPLAVQIVRILVLLMVLVTVPLSSPNTGAGHHGIALTAALTASAVSWIIWQSAWRRPRVWVVALAVMGAAGGVLAGLSSLSTGVAVGFVVTISAGARLPTAPSLAITAETIAAFLIAGLTTRAPTDALFGWAAFFAGAWAFGVTRRAYVLRAIEAEEALEQARRAHDAETQAAALGERARIAREIHDVLAHSLAAVSVNLQAAEGLLAALPPGSPELAKAIECVERAGALTKEGMAETRRAILALRVDETGDRAGQADHDDQGGRGVAPEAVAGAGRLTARLRALADEHRADGDAAVEFSVTGEPFQLAADAGLTVYRTVQEALTNARKHAPGQPVTVTVVYGPAGLTVDVSNPLPPAGTASPLAHAGAGYGLTGLRERAALARGTLTAGPADGQWRVSLTIPGSR